MIKWRCILLLLFLVTLQTSVCASDDISITDYHRVFMSCHDSHHNLKAAIRQYSVNGIPYFLLVNPYTFTTNSMPTAKLVCDKHNTQDLDKTPYVQALAKYSLPPYKLQNYGMVATDKSVNGAFLTTDMCPANKPFEKKFFETLAATSNNPVAVALSITGLWMIKHPQEMEWLLEQEKAGKLQIIWINHTFSHPFGMGSKNIQNNLELLENNFDHEILAVEKMLLEKNETPSVFFRFPGLFSNEILVLKLREFGLISVGTNAWLAIGEEAKDGSIILVHGNSNEPLGISKIMPILQSKQFNLLPLTLAP